MKRVWILILLTLVLCACEDNDEIILPETAAVGVDCGRISDGLAKPAMTDISENLLDSVTTKLPETELFEAVEDERVQFIRTDGFMELFPVPHLVKIEERTQFDEYYSLFSGIYDLEYREDYAGDYTAGWLDAVEMYDDDFFVGNILYMAVLEEPSGGIRHIYSGIEDDYVNIDYSETTLPLTDDMAGWHIFISAAEPLRGMMLGASEYKSKRTSDVIYTVEEMAEKLKIYLWDIAAGAVVGKIGETDHAILTDFERMTYGEAKTQDITNPYGYDASDDSPVWRVTVKSEGWLFKLYLNYRGTFAGEAKSNPIIILE